MLVKVGRPILGMYLKIGQNRTRVGRYLKKVTKKWDILYEHSLIGQKNTWTVPTKSNHEENNLEKNLKKIFFSILFSGFSSWHRGIYKVQGKSQLQGFKKCYGGS